MNTHEGTFYNKQGAQSFRRHSMDFTTILLIVLTALICLVFIAVLNILFKNHFSLAASKQEADAAQATAEQGIEAVARQQAADTATLQATLAAQAQNINVLTERMDSLRNSLTDQLSRDSQNLTARMMAQMGQIDQKLAAVNTGLGQMSNLASSVGDLQKVLGNVKTRGNLGEVQLSALLSEILAPSQYEENVATKPGSTKRVEFAVRIPTGGNEKILLPIDAKFPGDTYASLIDASETGDPAALETARKNLVDTVRREAKDISEKYISVPSTTNFALMFLPFEGLYAEVVQQPELIEKLSRDYSVTVAGPSTIVALLNSLQMSYQTIAIQKQTNDILRVLQSVKAEMPKYQASLMKAKRQIDTAGKTLDEIITTRTNVMERKLKDISLPKQLQGAGKERTDSNFSRDSFEGKEAPIQEVEFKTETLDG